MKEKLIMYKEMEQHYIMCKNKEKWMSANAAVVSLLEKDQAEISIVKDTLLKNVEDLQSDLEQAASNELRMNQEEFNTAMDTMKRIKLHCGDLLRAIKPVSSYADLVARCEAIYNASVVTIVSDDGLTIGSTDELLFSYQDCESGVLNLYCTMSKKRKLERSSPDSIEEPEIGKINTGRWTSAEILKLKEGVELFGESDHVAISNHVISRTRIQVRDFIAKSPYYKRFKISPTCIIDGLKAAIDGMSNAVDGIRQEAVASRDKTE